MHLLGILFSIVIGGMVTMFHLEILQRSYLEFGVAMNYCYSGICITVYG